MLKKLLQYLSAVFSPVPARKKHIIEAPQSIIQKHVESHQDHVKAHAEAVLGIKEVTQAPPVSYATLNLDTGKIVLPDNLTPEEKIEVEAALKELNESLQKHAPEDLFKSLEDFISSSSKLAVFPVWEGVTPVNKDDNSLVKVCEEMEFCDETTEHWNDIDFAEALHEMEEQGYEFTGVEQIYMKINSQLELAEDEKRKLREWYKLATQEFVYGV